MKHHLRTEVGGHAENEDAVIVRFHPNDASLLLGALADGQGGGAGGARAAWLAVETCVGRATENMPLGLAEPSQWVGIGEVADHAVRDDAEAGFTTLVSWVVSDRYIVGASAGDSAAYLWTDGQVTELTKGQCKNPPVGSGGARLTPFSALPLAPWRLLVMSDGVWKYVGSGRVAELLATHAGDELLGALRNDVLRGWSGTLPDDFTAVVVDT